MYLLSDLSRDLTALRARGARVFSAGTSVLGQDIPAISIGSKPPVVLVHASIHAREHVTSRILMRLLRTFEPRYSSLIAVPVANPDGVKIATEGTNFLVGDTKKLFDQMGDVRTIKCNARGVDINVNFDARWGEGAQNVFFPSAQNYVGPFPESEPETVALTNLTTRFRPVVSLSLHASGRVIYWRFGARPFYEAEYREMAGKYAESTGYVLADAEGSVGGYKDWFIKENFGLGLTIELGPENVVHHELYSYEQAIMKEMKEVLCLADEHAREIFRRRVYDSRP